MPKGPRYMCGALRRAANESSLCRFVEGRVGSSAATLLRRPAVVMRSSTPSSYESLCSLCAFTTRLACTTLGVALLSSAGCGGEADPESAAIISADVDSRAGTGEQVLAAQRAERAKAQSVIRVNERLESIEAAHASEQARWTRSMHKRAAKLAKSRHRSSKAGLAKILASPHRKPAHRERDQFRHPMATLRFLGLRPGDRVLEAGSGAGWYSEIIAPLVARSGQLTITSADPDAPPESMARAYARRTELMLERSPALFGGVELRPVRGTPTAAQLGEAESVDLALAIREMHGWHRRGQMQAYLESIFEVLAPGGRFGVVQHRAADGADPDESAKSGYLPEAWLVRQVEAAGFRLAARSEINANPRDDRNHPHGVWSLPPSLAGGEASAEAMRAIGESDRMTLRFVKPKSNT